MVRPIECKQLQIYVLIRNGFNDISSCLISINTFSSYATS